MIINVLIFAYYVVGVFGSLVSVYSLMCRFRMWGLSRIVVLTLGSFIPVMNYRLMWEGFKEYENRMAGETV